MSFASPNAAVTLAQRLDAVLPQTQCRRCGYDGCPPYAEAMAAGDAINRCAPGGDALIATLASITGRPQVPLDPAHGVEAPPTVATIDESRCIGCTLCIDACPIDAIVGAAKRMHVVLTAQCSGCDLCVAPCPVDCIAMVPAGRTWTRDDARAARSRYDARKRRRTAEVAARTAPAPAADSPSSPTAGGLPGVPDPQRDARREAVAAALERARARRGTTTIPR
jgi:electron transport complex protein RnfB